MHRIVRVAQGDFQFSTIYEQRRTNQILVSGFKSLGQAIDGMRHQIGMAVEQLHSSVESLATALDDRLQDVHSRIGDLIETGAEQHEDYIEHERQHAERDEAALGMLDNIQRKRLPR